MRSVRWHTLLNPDRKAGTVVHFLPATPGAATPYPVELSLSIFGRGITSKTVSIDGARLFHPDGVKVEDAFALSGTEAESMIGLRVEVYSNQLRSDVSASQCLVEFADRSGPITFAPSRYIVKQDSTSDKTQPIEDIPERAVYLVKDAVLAPSIVALNSLDIDYRPEITVRDGIGPQLGLLPLGQVAPKSVLERKLDGALFNEIAPQEMSWGNVRTRLFSTKSEAKETALFLLYRDARTTKIVSVQAL